MIIGLGYKARVGKDTVADFLVKNFDFVQESFAYPLKEYIGREIFGFNDKQLYGEWKEVVDPEWGKTPRQLLQLTGTDALRDKVHQDIWVIPMKRKLKKHLQDGRNIVISDCRFLNEIKMIKSLGGYVVNVQRTNPDKISNTKHKSELELENFDDWDYVLDNNGDMEELYSKALEMYKKFRG